MYNYKYLVGHAIATHPNFTKKNFRKKFTTILGLHGGEDGKGKNGGEEEKGYDGG
jgi:hypothetical protein